MRKGRLTKCCLDLLNNRSWLEILKWVSGQNRESVPLTSCRQRRTSLAAAREDSRPKKWVKSWGVSVHSVGRRCGSKAWLRAAQKGGGVWWNRYGALWVILPQPTLAGFGSSRLNLTLAKYLWRTTEKPFHQNSRVCTCSKWLHTKMSDQQIIG